MSDPSSTSDETPSPSQGDHLDVLCDRFEAAWKRGERPRVEDYLSDPTGKARSELLHELLVLDLAYRERVGERVFPSDYLARFPEDEPVIRAAFKTAAVSATDGETSSFDLATTRNRAGRAQAAVNDLQVADYETLDELGRGGMGVVYRARHRSLNRLVALKMIRAGAHADAEQLARFRIEAEAVARLQNPNIVQIHDIGEVNGSPFVALELLEGGDLASRLAGTPQPGPLAAELLKTLATAMHAAHQAGIIHRDLKPANVLFTRDGVPKITDFGLAKRLEVEEGQTESGQVMGTPSYMAPEQARGQSRAIGSTADVYALGAILYEMLTGRPPFKGPTALETLRQVVEEDVVHPSRLQHKVPRDLETICLKCLSKEPARRYATAKALADDLGRYLTGEPVLARRTGVLERGVKWARRRPLAATFVAAGVIATAIGLGAGLWYDADAKERTRLENLRVDRVRQVGLEALLDGQGALARRDWGTGTVILTNLRTALKKEDRLTDLDARAKDLLRQIEHEIAAEKTRDADHERHRLFLHYRNEAYFHATHFNGLDLPVNREAVRRASKAALSLFSPADRDDSRALVTLPATLSPREQAEVVDGSYEILLITSAATDRAEEGLRLLDRAARLRPRLTRAFHLRKAACLERAADHAGAHRERVEAERLEPVSAFDHFLTGFDHFLTGWERYDRREWRLAIRHFDATIRLQQDHFWAQCLSAICYIQMSRPEDAKPALNACLQREPGFVWLYLLRGFASGQLAARDLKRAANVPVGGDELLAGAEDQFEAAEFDYRRAEELLEGQPNPELRWILLANRGLMRYERRRLDDAAADLDEAIRLKGDHYQAFTALAEVYRMQGKPNEATEQFDQAIRLRSDWAPLYRGRAHITLKDPDATPARRANALNDLDQAIRLEEPGSPNLAGDFTNRGKLLYRDQPGEKALAAFDAALKVVPDFAEAHHLRIDVLVHLKRYDEVVRSCTALLAKEPSAELFELRATYKAASKDFVGAIEDYTQALALSANRPRLLTRRGWTYLVSNAPGFALADFDEILRNDPSSADAYNGRGSARVRLGLYREAVTDAESALAHGETTSRMAYNAARIYAQAAALAAAEVRRKGRAAVVLVGKYQDRAVSLLREAVQRLPAEQRLTFCRDQVPIDPALRPIRRRLSFGSLADPPASPVR